MTEATNSGPKLKDFACRRPEDCSNIDGTYCDADLGFCLCKPDYPVTDTNHCYKGRDCTDRNFVVISSQQVLHFDLEVKY